MLERVRLRVFGNGEDKTTLGLVAPFLCRTIQLGDCYFLNGRLKLEGAEK